MAEKSPRKRIVDTYDNLSNDKSDLKKLMIRAYDEHIAKVTDLMDQFDSTDDWGKKEQLLKQVNIEKEKFEHLIKEIEEGITDAESLLDKTARKEIASLTKYYINKITTKPHAEGGVSYNQKKKYIRISKRYEKLKETKSPTRARNMIMQKEKISLSTFTKYLTKGNKLRKK